MKGSVVHVLILGAAGMIGRKLAARLVTEGHLAGGAVERLTLADVVPPRQPAGDAGRIELVSTDLAAPG